VKSLSQRLPDEPIKPISGSSSYDAIAEFYDDDMGRNADVRDISFYSGACSGITGRILELGCGTGRITLPLAELGLDVIGIDRSPPMLRVLRRKAAALPSVSRVFRPPRVVAMDMAHAALNGQFEAVLCPFSAFTYLVTAADRERALAFIGQALAPNGRFLLDVFVPNEAVEAGADGNEQFDYRRRLDDGSELERRKTVISGHATRVNRIVRRYIFRDAAGVVRRELVTESHQRSYLLPELLDVIRGAGFRLVAATADFTGAPIRAGARTMVIEAMTR
jgi:SAM-dependent methyltransferase